MRKNPHGRILKREPKEQYLSTVLRSCSYYYSLLNFWNRNPCSKLISSFKHIIHNSQSKEEKKKVFNIHVKSTPKVFFVIVLTFPYKTLTFHKMQTIYTDFI